MRILIAVASRHGSTYEIAATIAQELRVAGHTVDVRQIEEVDALKRYEAVIIGSAVYVGNWLTEARKFIDHSWVQLSRVPVWLFSSGPLGLESPQPTSGPQHLQDLMEKTGARDHRLFVGKLDTHALGIGELIVARVVGAPEGDFRDWEAIRAWGREIVAALATEHVAVV